MGEGENGGNANAQKRAVLTKFGFFYRQLEWFETYRIELRLRVLLGMSPSFHFKPVGPK